MIIDGAWTQLGAGRRLEDGIRRDVDGELTDIYSRVRTRLSRPYVATILFSTRTARIRADFGVQLKMDYRRVRALTFAGRFGTRCWAYRRFDPRGLNSVIEPVRTNAGALCQRI